MSLKKTSASCTCPVTGRVLAGKGWNYMELRMPGNGNHFVLWHYSPVWLENIFSNEPQAVKMEIDFPQDTTQVTSQGEVQRLVEGQTKLWATLDQAVVEAMLQTGFSTMDAYWFSGKGQK